MGSVDPATRGSIKIIYLVQFALCAYSTFIDHFLPSDKFIKSQVGAGRNSGNGVNSGKMVETAEKLKTCAY